MITFFYAYELYKVNLIGYVNSINHTLRLMQKAGKSM